MRECGEYCDDGNNIDGDGCDSYCNVETGASCDTDYITPDVCMYLQIGWEEEKE
jgi:cysteine-rich repeat protein